MPVRQEKHLARQIKEQKPHATAKGEKLPRYTCLSGQSGEEMWESSTEEFIVMEYKRQIKQCNSSKEKSFQMSSNRE